MVVLPIAELVLVYLRFPYGAERRQKIEIASLVGLPDVFGIQSAVAARITWAWRLPAGAAARHDLVADMQVDAARRNVDLDLVTGLHERQRAADKTLRRDVQDAGAVAGAA